MGFSSAPPAACAATSRAPRVPPQFVADRLRQDHLPFRRCGRREIACCRCRSSVRRRLDIVMAADCKSTARHSGYLDVRLMAEVAAGGRSKQGRPSRRGGHSHRICAQGTILILLALLSGAKFLTCAQSGPTAAGFLNRRCDHERRLYLGPNSLPPWSILVGAGDGR